jgi:hypothetical protein
MYSTILSLVVSLVAVNAFALTTGKAAMSSLRMAFAGGLAGAAGPELKNFDPFRFSEKSPEWLPWFREAELKHGRVCMLATAGYVTADFVKLPGDIHQVSSFEAHKVFVESGAMLQILFWVALIELLTVPALIALKNGKRAPGDYSFDPLKLGQGAKLEKYKINELKNGRLAMMAFSGIITQAALNNGAGFPYF